MKNKTLILLTIAITALLLTLPITQGLQKTTKSVCATEEIQSEEKQKTNLTDKLINLSKPLIRLLGLIFTIYTPVTFVFLHMLLLKQIGGFAMTYGVLFLYGLFEGFLLQKPFNESIKMGLLFTSALPVFFIVSLKLSIHMLFTGEIPEDITLPDFSKN
jgi:hypothetical protein